MRHKILFILACISLYVFSFVADTFYLSPEAIGKILGSTAAMWLVVKVILKKGITVKLFLSWMPTFFWLLMLGSKRVLTRFGFEQSAKFIFIRFARIRDRSIGLYMLVILKIQGWDYSTEEKSYLTVIFLPITVPIITYVYLTYFLRKFVATKVIEIIMGSALQKFLPDWLVTLLQKIQIYLLEKAVAGKKKAQKKAQKRVL